MILEMNAKEKRLWDQIVAYWSNEFGRPFGHSDARKSEEIGQKQRALTMSLLKRGAIPARRLRWVDSPDFFIGSKKSRLKVFCDNFRAHDDRIFEHPHWYSQGYLPFLVGVISLPEAVIEEFRADAANTMNNTYEMGMKYRRIARSDGLPKKCADEFFKLAVDCGYHADDCRAIRDIIFRYLR